MALHGIIADIHGNREALIAVLGALSGLEAGRIVCLGDIVGYNADGNECAGIVRGRGIRSIAGNHDLIAIGRLGFERCSNKARYALRRTRRDLTEETRQFLGGLPDHDRLDGRTLLIHGGVDDVQLYMRSAGTIAENARLLPSRHPGVEVCFFGHTHVPVVWEAMSTGPRALPAEGRIGLDAGRTWFVNPGSVDPSRKREHKMAEFALFHSGENWVEFHRVAYDHESAEEKSARAGYRIDRWSHAAWSAHRLLRRSLRGVRGLR